jgi:hypothetical protein
MLKRREGRCVPVSESEACMIEKQRESRKSAIDQLEGLLRQTLSDRQKNLIQQELRTLKSGDKGEKDSAYYIDFKYGSNRNWAVIHDLRLEFEGNVAQIDHILMNRFFDIYVLESKRYADGAQITPEGEFQVLCKGGYRPIESPIKQNERHIYLLEKVIERFKIMPTKARIRILPKFKNYVLVSPDSKIIRPPKRQFDTSHVIKSDLLVKQIDKEFDKTWVAVAIAKMCSSETLLAVANQLAGLHSPASIDYQKKFGMIVHPTVNAVKQNTGLRVTHVNAHHEKCFACHRPITVRVADYCQERPAVYGGKVYCFNCQKLIPGHIQAQAVYKPESLGAGSKSGSM